MKKEYWAVAIIIVILILVGGYIGRHRIKHFITGSPSTPSSQTNISVTKSTSPSHSSSSSGTIINNSLILTRSIPGKGEYLADPKGMTLYTFDKDKPGLSNCVGACSKIWPPYLEGSNRPANLPPNVGLIKRSDGSSQYSWKGMPLYYYASDSKPGDTNGDGIGGIWHIAKP